MLNTVEGSSEGAAVSKASRMSHLPRILLHLTTFVVSLQLHLSIGIVGQTAANEAPAKNNREEPSGTFLLENLCVDLFRLLENGQFELDFKKNTAWVLYLEVIAMWPLDRFVAIIVSSTLKHFKIKVACVTNKKYALHYHTVIIELEAHAYSTFS